MGKWRKAPIGTMFNHVYPYITPESVGVPLFCYQLGATTRKLPRECGRAALSQSPQCGVGSEHALADYYLPRRAYLILSSKMTEGTMGNMSASLFLACQEEFF